MALGEHRLDEALPRQRVHAPASTRHRPAARRTDRRPATTSGSTSSTPRSSRRRRPRSDSSSARSSGSRSASCSPSSTCCGAGSCRTSSRRRRSRSSRSRRSSSAGSGSVSIGGWPPPDWVRVSVIAAYLTFFPVTVNTMRGLRSADPWALELMHSYAARGWTILWKLRVPSALPYIFTALKIAATASVVGAIIGEAPASIQHRASAARSSTSTSTTSRAREPVGDEPLRGAARHLVLPRRRCSPRSSSCVARPSGSYERAVRRLAAGRLEGVRQGRSHRARRASTSRSSGASSSR